MKTSASHPNDLAPAVKTPPDGYSADEWAEMVRAADAVDWETRPAEPKPPRVMSYYDPRKLDLEVYFIGSEAGPIKIGLSRQPEIRIQTLQSGSPVRLWVMASVPGDIQLERAYHARFAEHRLHGEWFANHPDILAEIDRLNAAPQQENQDD